MIARAGIGIDNINVTAATNAGIAVINAPTGNIIAAAEHTIGFLIASARHIPQAAASMKSGLDANIVEQITPTTETKTVGG